ncbi:MAG: hypothetical protein ABIH90_00105 [Candidatus Aenigmatarchaeota archaeon]
MKWSFEMTDEKKKKTKEHTAVHKAKRKIAKPKIPKHVVEKREKPKPHKGKVHGKGKMEVEFVTRIPDGELKHIRHKVNDYSDILTLETSIDKLYEMVQKEGEVKIRDAAKRFGVEPELAEEWGRVLESHELVEMHYPAFGELVLRSKSWAEKHKHKKKAEPEEQPKA